VKLVKKIKHIVFKKKKFKSSTSYWIERYRFAGNSGNGSYNKLAEFKGEIVNDFVLKHEINSVIEFGCGDGNQLQYYNFKSYDGYDVSPDVIRKCKKLFKNDTTKRFHSMSQFTPKKADLSMSVDVIYHLVEDDIFNDYMEKLFDASRKYVIIYSSNSSNHENNGKAPHVRHREFTAWIEANRSDFELIKHIPNRYPYNGIGEVSSYADFYLFRKVK